MGRVTGKVGSATPFEAADGDLVGGSDGGCHNARAVVEVRRDRARTIYVLMDNVRLAAGGGWGG